MTDFVVDTNVISELVRPRPLDAVVSFFEREDELWLSALVLHELTFGIDRLPRGARKSALASAVRALAGRFERRIVPVGANIAETAGRMRAESEKRGVALDAIDSLMAATAVEKNAVLATRNVNDFRGLRLRLYNPWA